MMQNGFLRGYVASDEDNAVLKFLLQEFQVGAYTLNPYIEISTLLTVKGHPFTVATVIEGVDAGKINVTWDNSDDQNGIPLAVRRAGSSTVIGYGTLLYNRSISALYRYQVNAATGVATFVLDRSTVTAEFKEHPRSNNLKQWFSAGEIAVIMKNLSDQAVVELQKVLRNIEESAVSLDYFVLNSILFNNETHIKTEESSMPGDLIFFGQFNYPFTISPLEYLMGHGTTHKFQVSPEYKGDLQWEVSAVPGSTGAIGSINQEGVYTSPAITDIGGTFTRVRVTAKDKQSQYSSSALVTVVVRDITINPVVQICNASTPSTLETRTLSANTLGEGILEWKVKTGGGTIPLTAGPDRKNIYTAGQQDSSVGTLSVDEIEVRNLATQKTQSSYVVVTHDSSDRLTITIVMEESSFPAGKAKLVVMKRGSELPVDWEVVVGNGEIDDSGMYTGRDGQHRFALIVATDKTDEYRKGWIILPWPLFELPDKPPDDFLE
jgi:hypothetical protein